MVFSLEKIVTQKYKLQWLLSLVEYFIMVMIITNKYRYKNSDSEAWLIICGLDFGQDQGIGPGLFDLSFNGLNYFIFWNCAII